MSEFKIGDKVRRKKIEQSPHNSYYQGNPFTIENLYFNNNETKDPAGAIHHVRYLELESVSSNEILQELVDKANEGRKAVDIILEKYQNSVEQVFSSGNVSLFKRYESDLGARIRIKSQTKKFKVAHWDAEINEKEVKIGCKTFTKYDLIQDIKNLVTKNGSVSGNFYAQRMGIQYEGSHISWQVAENLLKELES